MSGDLVNMHVSGLIISTATAPSDLTPPDAPTGLVAISNLDSIRLDWDAPADEDLDSYIVSRSTNSGMADYIVIASGVTDSNYIDTSFAAYNTPYYYVVAAKDTAGNVSENSNEASGTVFNAAIVADTADLDLTNVVKAINLGDTSTQRVLGTDFLQAWASTTVDGVSNDAGANIAGWQGTVPTLSGTDGGALSEIYASNVYNPDVVNISTDLVPGMYKVQVLLYEKWTGDRTVTVTAESTVADPLIMSTRTHPGGLVVECTTPVSDGTLNIVVSEVSTATNMHVAGLIVNVIEFYVPAIVDDPDPLTVWEGDLAGFTVNAQNVFSYIWKKDGTPVVDDVTISGQGTAVLTIDPVALADEGNYSCDISGDGSLESVPAQLLTKRLIGHWPLDTDPNDTEGGWNGTQGPLATSTFVTGQIDGALAMDPIATPDDMITVAGSADYFNFYPRGITVSLWVNQPEDAINQNMAYKANPATWTEGWIIWNNFSAGAGSNIQESGTILYGVFDNDTWHQVVGTYDREAGTQRLYIDGIAVSEVTGIAPISLAGNTGLLNFGFTGIIDDVKIYSFARDAADIAQDYADEGNSTVCFERPTLDVAPVGALDCIVSLPDLAEFALQWLLDGNKYDQTE